MPRFALTGAAALLVLALSPGLSVAKRQSGETRPVPVAPGAGKYACHILTIGGTIATPYGAAPTITVMPSALISMELDGSGGYRHSSGGGRFHYENGTGRAVFDSGPFDGWPVLSETDGESRWLRFAAKKDAALAPTSRLGDHICVLQE